MNKRLLLIAALIAASSTVTGCASVASFFGTAAEKGAQAADLELASTEWGMCNAATIGAVRRKFGKSPDLAAAYNKLCSEGDADVVTGRAP